MELLFFSTEVVSVAPSTGKRLKLQLEKRRRRKGRFTGKEEEDGVWFGFMIVVDAVSLDL